MAEEKEDEKKPKSKKKFIIIGIALLLLGGGGFFGYKFFLAKPKEQPTKATEQVEKKGETKKEKKKKEEQPKEIVTKVVPLPTLLVNLADPLGRRYLKISISIEVKGEKTPSLIEEDTPKIKDTLILLLSSKTFDDLNSFDKKIELKKEIVERINQILGKPVVRRVYFTEFIVQ